MVVATVQPSDVASHARAVEQSRARLRSWNPVNPHELAWHLRNQTPRHQTFIIHARQVDGDHDVVGRVNVTNILRGRAHAASLGYDAYDPYAGRGLFAEGLRLVVDLAFRREPDGLGLHRVEAHVQPGNVRSAGMLRSLGFRRRGAWPAYLTLPDATGVEGWRDHVVYGVLAEEWPGHPYPVTQRVRPLVFIAGAEEVGEEVARDVAAEVAEGAGQEVARVARGVAAEVAEDLGLLLLDTTGLRRIGATGLAESLVMAARGGAVVTGPVASAERSRIASAAGVAQERVTVVAVPGRLSRSQVVQLELEIMARAGGHLP